MGPLNGQDLDHQEAGAKCHHRDPKKLVTHPEMIQNWDIQLSLIVFNSVQ